MSYSTLAAVAVSLAFLAGVAAVAAAVLFRVRRRRWADGALGLMIGLLLGATAFAFAAGARGNHDLQAKARHVLSLAASAERAAELRFGRYTTSVIRLQRLSPALAGEMRLYGAIVQIGPRTRTGSVRLRVWMGFGNPTAVTLRPSAAQ